MRRSAALVLSLSLFAGCMSGSEEAPKKAFEAAAPEATRSEGLLPLRLDAKSGQAWLELPAPDASGELARFLWVESLVTGLGSNPVGLDRGQLGDARLVVLRRVGAKVLLEQPNLRFRATTTNAEEARATREAFASSVIWANEIAAERDDGSLLLEITDFLLRDAHDIASTLKRTDQGAFTLDEARSTLDPEACLAFPDNLVFESLLTFGGSEPGSHVRSVAPDPTSLTFRVRHQFVRLPDAGYEPRPWHPGQGAFALTHVDMAAPLDEEVTKRVTIRHRLELDESGRVKEPIVYHVDPGIPEPVLSAVLDGAGWWAVAFEKAGLPGAYRVEVLPEGVHPLDVRYNVIQWVHRSTRGWSYGTGVIDPRTGERINGHVNLGSLRVRQDRLLIEALAGRGKTGTGEPDDPIQVALARIRQLAAHEVGHALGLAHSFAASTQHDRASVMDYPFPRVRIRPDESFDFSDAYGVGVGRWDEAAVRLAYAPLEGGEEELARLTAELSKRHLYLSDSDARPAGAAHPLASLWDDGSDPVLSLERILKIRRIALRRFGAESLDPDLPLALLQERFVPLYFLHRYQVSATAKSIGGVEYRHGLAGEAADLLGRPTRPETQRQALASLLGCLDPSELDVPERVIRSIVPRPGGVGGNRELFSGRTAPSLDALGLAQASADQTLGAIFQRERVARLVDQHRRSPRALGFEELVRSVSEALFPTTAEENVRLAEIRRLVQARYVHALSRLAFDEEAAPQVHVRARQALRDLDGRLAAGFARDAADKAQVTELREAIASAFERRRVQADAQASPLALPPGSPIGDLGACSHEPDWLR